MAFCMNCGQQLPEDAKFCSNCGAATGEVKSEAAQRKITYDGKLHKCPNCGEVMESFLTVCPTCGYEIRDVRSASSVRELAVKLENISAQKMTNFEEKKSVMKMVFGKDFKESDEAEEALRRFESQKIRKKHL